MWNQGLMGMMNSPMQQQAQMRPQGPSPFGQMMMQRPQGPMMGRVGMAAPQGPQMNPAMFQQLMRQRQMMMANQGRQAMPAQATPVPSPNPSQPIQAQISGNTGDWRRAGAIQLQNTYQPQQAPAPQRSMANANMGQMISSAMNRAM